MKNRVVLSMIVLCAPVILTGSTAGAQSTESQAEGRKRLTIHLLERSQEADNGPLILDDLFFETADGRTPLPAELLNEVERGIEHKAEMQKTDGRTVRLAIVPQGDHFVLNLSAQPDSDIVKWGLSMSAGAKEYFTGLMERVVDGPQEASWAPGIQEAMDLRGQTVEMIVKPTTSVYAPFFLSSRGYAVFVKSNWPGLFDFCAADPGRVKIEIEGPSFEMKIYASKEPSTLVREHALDAGPPFLPPKWAFAPWRWRDEHTHRSEYYDGTPATGPFNSEVMEDVLMMKAYGIPCGVYWIDRPYGPGSRGYDDFEIDPKRLPRFPEMVRWLDSRRIRTLMWIAPFFQGAMAREALARGYSIPGQQPSSYNFPLADLTHPEARAYWQEGVAKLLKLGVAGFKLDRSEEEIPETGPDTVFDGRSVREQRNAYPALYVQAAHEIASKHRGDDFVLMPRAAYTGSAPWGVFWGGDIGGTQEGLRASIIAVQRAAVMGYPNWGSDTCGYNLQLMEQEVCGRWLAFSCFTPIMEVGPTRNRGFWDLPREPSYDAELIAVWRLYARLHDRLIDYTYRFAQVAHETGMPIVRPLFLVDPASPESWSNWWTYLYGEDLLVSPIWEKGRRAQQVYLPAGETWQDAWRPDKTYEGGRSIAVDAAPHQIPLFIRVGSTVQLGDLNREWEDARSAAQQRPDLASLEAEVKEWIDRATAGE
ncbi:MAG: alpha-glucosidase [Vicinamibacteria bacterium]|nr:alpha-glucosidase [Vicinamibacteria bacterium]